MNSAIGRHVYHNITGPSPTLRMEWNAGEIFIIKNKKASYRSNRRNPRSCLSNYVKILCQPLPDV